MQDGLYKVTFHVNHNSGDGIVTIAGGKVSGGDFGFIYFGSFIDEGGTIKADVEVRQHAPGAPNVFAGLTNFKLNATGAAASSTRARLNGTTPAAPGQELIVDLVQLTTI